jgi:hypothetical protein
MASVIIHGFQSDRAAKTFIEWFGQGEQMQEDWFDEANLKGQIVDIEGTFPLRQDSDSNWIMQLQKL